MALLSSTFLVDPSNYFPNPKHSFGSHCPKELFVRHRNRNRRLSVTVSGKYENQNLNEPQPADSLRQFTASAILLLGLGIRVCSAAASTQTPAIAVADRPTVIEDHIIQGPLKKMYAFGDSYTDTGNTGSTSGPSGFSYVSNLPYGRTYFHHSTNCYFDGRLVVDFVAQSLSLPYLPPYLHLINSNQKPSSMGVNFAVAGSTAEQPHTQHHSSVPSNLAYLVQQLLGVSGV